MMRAFELLVKFSHFTMQVFKVLVNLSYFGSHIVTIPCFLMQSMFDVLCLFV